MRLLNAKSRKLEVFGGDNIPLYAILSHTWGKDEITFQDVERGSAEGELGYEKIRNTCKMAIAHDLDYVWIDTCCIDKTSSAELSEAINSMYRWYQDSAVCYVYLADVPTFDYQRHPRILSPKFSKSRWFTRGWTLQELIAPSTVIILNREWQEIGTKLSLKEVISRKTRVPINILLGGNLEDASIAQRMSWASNRETTRIEDLAYCLLGIFGINLPLLYGEGERAFIRLQEEIIRVSDDHSLFAWKSFARHGSLLATSPAAFSKSGNIIRYNPTNTLSGAITVNNKGIHLSLYFKALSPISGLAILPCTENGQQVVICLRALSEAKDYFIREECNKLELINIENFNQLGYGERSLCVQIRRQIYVNQSSLPRAAKEGREAVVEVLLKNGAELETKDTFYGRTPLSWAAANGHEAVARLLIANGAELETRDTFYGRTPLSLAALNGHEALVKLLLDNRAEIETKDKASGRTAVTLASEAGHVAVVKLLRKRGAR